MVSGDVEWWGTLVAKLILEGTVSAESRLLSLKVDPHNIHTVCETVCDADVELLLVDTNDTCNADCVYCPNPRSSARIQIDDFVRMLDGPIRHVRTWQFG